MFLEIPKGWAYKWENHAVYVSKDDGATWTLAMYFPPKATTASKNLPTQ